MSNINEIALEIYGQFYSSYVGQVVRVTPYGEEHGFGVCDNTTVAVREIEDNGSAPDAEITVELLDEQLPKYEEGKWLTLWIGDFVRIFSNQRSRTQVVNRDFMYKKRNLKGERCRILANIDRRDVFVEMENNIGGGSCDGIGKKGHCIHIKKEFLISSNKKSKKAKGG